jgi:hypothetical protein
MKTRITLIALMFLSINLFSQGNNHLLKFGDTELGAYLGTSTKYTNIGTEPAGFLDFKGAVVVNSKWGFGVSVSGLYYDKKLDALVTDGTYHLYVSYASIYIERIFTIIDDFKISLSITSGQGEAFYQYDQDYRKDKIWSEEIIDKTTFYVFEPGFEIQNRVAGNFWIGLTGSFRTTSPVKLIGASENMLEKFTGGLTFKWGVF